MTKILIVGTSHIAKESVDQVKRVIEQTQPEVVAVELDKGRLASLQHPSAKRPSAIQIIRRVGVQGFLFSIIGQWIQQKLGSKVGMDPGKDMLSATNEPLAK